VPGLGTSFGRGGATTFVQDLQNADCILIEGSNFAECHPVAFRFVMEAKERGAKIIHVDPRYTRTSAVADLYAPIRSGTDIVFLGALINWLLENERYFKEYVVAYTNASYHRARRFPDTEDLDGLFSGFIDVPADGRGGGSAGRRRARNLRHVVVAVRDRRGAAPTATARSPCPSATRRSQHPRCVINVCAGISRAIRPRWSKTCAARRARRSSQIANLLADNSGRERTTAFAYAVGWTQHTVGVQYIRTAAILQMLLGNMGRPGGGIMALARPREHSRRDRHSDALRSAAGLSADALALREEQTLAQYLKNATKPTGWWSNTPKYVVSLLKAYYGDAATPENDFCFDYLPQIVGDHSTLPTQIAMKDGNVKGYFVIGHEPGVVGPQRRARARGPRAAGVDGRRRRLRNGDGVVLEARRRRSGNIGTELFFFRPTSCSKKTARWSTPTGCLQWHDKAVEPAGDARSDLYIIHQLGCGSRSSTPAPPIRKIADLRDLTWDYPHEDRARTRARRTLGAQSAARDQRLLVEPGKPGYECAQVAGFAASQGRRLDRLRRVDLQRRHPDKQTNRARNRKGDDVDRARLGLCVAREPAHALQPRLGRSRRQAVERTQEVHLLGRGGRSGPAPTCPIFPWTSRRMPRQTRRRRPRRALRQRSLHHASRRPRAALRCGRAQGRSAAGALRTARVGRAQPRLRQQNNPALREWDRDDNRYNGPQNARLPYVLTTYRLTEQSGIMTRYVPWLAELQPALFAEIDPELAVAKFVRNGDWVTISTLVGEIEARALVSGRMRPLRLGKGQRVHQIGIPYNYGPLGHSSGDAVGDLVSLAMDPNVSIHEAKTISCTILRAGRRASLRSGEVDRDVPPEQRTLRGESRAHGRDGGGGPS
jgi:formate dehydrogenase major subunit